MSEKISKINYFNLSGDFVMSKHQTSLVRASDKVRIYALKWWENAQL